MSGTPRCTLGAGLVLAVLSIAALAVTAVATAQDTKNPAFAACLKKNGVDISKNDFSKDPDMPKALAACKDVGTKKAAAKGDFPFSVCLKKNGVDMKSKNWAKDKDLPKATTKCRPLLEKKSVTVACLKKKGVDLRKKNWAKDKDLPKALGVCEPLKSGKKSGAKKKLTTAQAIAEINKLVAAGKLDPETAAAKKKALQQKK